jgi:catechol 2,3-dioxygenase-like lactoylglutathione lyase family enzyme
MSLSLGRFHEISISSRSLDESLDFYLALGFERGVIETVWPHPYAVLRSGPLWLGLHEYRFPSPSVTCVRVDLIAALEAFRDSGAVIAFAKTGPDCFNEFGLRDPAGHMITLLERPTHRLQSEALPVIDTSSAVDPSSLGRPLAFSLPSAACEISSGFWQAIGAQPYDQSIKGLPALLHDAAGLPLAIHDETWFPSPALLFQRTGLLEKLVLESPEGLALIVLPTDQ